MFVIELDTWFVAGDEGSEVELDTWKCSNMAMTG